MQSSFMASLFSFFGLNLLWMAAFLPASFSLPACGALTPAKNLLATEDWKQINDKDHVKVFTRHIPGSDIVAFKGSTVVEASAEKLLWVLKDNGHRTEWVDRLKTSTTLETVSSNEYVVYQEFNLPWPMRNRDYVYRGKAIRDPNTQQVVLYLESIDSPKAPVSKAVRAHLHYSAYRLTPLTPHSTMVEVEIHTDPKGMIPSWLVNLIQKSWPVKTLNGIRQQVQKNYVKEATLPPVENEVKKIEFRQG